jgi:hypothetical protein
MSDLDWGILANTTIAKGKAAAMEYLNTQGFVIVPLHPTAEMITEALHPARPGSIGDMYREMVKVGKVTA